MIKINRTKVERVTKVYGGNNKNKHQNKDKDRRFEDTLKAETEKYKQSILLDLSGSMGVMYTNGRYTACQ